MAAKTKAARLESEIEKCRADSNWSKAVDLARQVSTKSSQTLGIIASVLQASSIQIILYLPTNIPEIVRSAPAPAQVSDRPNHVHQIQYPGTSYHIVTPSDMQTVRRSIADTVPVRVLLLTVTL